ncbi:type III-A CRISPR-associated protein Csm2 [Deinococcus taklimakanensis]|uniref:CRISPR system Cms protein Csm2 n=1 Tax=Deinococcus taklimakanensis TaxID=536443 RepID=A0ABW5P145_9DEIO
MTWTQEFQKARGTAPTLSHIEDFNGLVALANTVGQGLQRGEVSSRQIRVLLSETTAGISRIRRGKTLGAEWDPNLVVQSDKTAQEKRTIRQEQENKAARQEAALLNITLIYSAARGKKGTAAIQDLAELLKVMTAHVRSFEDFKVLRKFSEAVMAYFKFHGGK